MKSNLLFLGGPPRSGTTLLQRILSNHPSVYAGVEFDFVPPIIRLRDRMNESVRSGRISEFLSEEDVDRHFSEFLGSILFEKLQKEKKKIISEKSPANAEVMPSLLDLFKCAKGIVSLRDPRDVVASLFSVGERFRVSGRTPPPICVDATSAINRYLAILDPTMEALKIFPERTRVVFYEDLVQNPEKYTTDILKFLELEYSISLVSVKDDSLLEKRDPTGIWHTEDQLRRNISSGSIGSWKTLLSHDVVAQIEGSFTNYPLLNRYFKNLERGKMD